MTPLVRSERPGDQAGVRAIHEAAFPAAAEAALVDALRERARPIVSLVAEEGGRLVGHILFSPVSLQGPPIMLMGLAPMAVVPDRHRQGIGTELVRAGLGRCRMLEVGAVFVLGHPEYYPRFGFVTASRFGIRCEYDAPDEAFLALEIRPGALDGRSGTVRYHDAFREVS